MKKYITILCFCLIYLMACNQAPSSLATKQNNGLDSSAEALDLEEGKDPFQPQMKDVSLTLLSEAPFVGGTLTLDLACDNVFGTGATDDWTMTNVAATSAVSIIQNKACRITVVSYYDGVTNTYTPVVLASPLVISISALGIVSPSSAIQYTSGGGTPVLQWFSAYPGGTDTVIINFASDAISTTTTVTSINLTGQSVSLAVNGVSAPTVSGLSLFSIPSINSAPASYTLEATVSGSTSCKYIDNSSGTYTPTSWSSVNTAFALATLPCPVFTPTPVSGNWTGLWGAGIKTLIIWANTVNNLSSYAVANIGP